MEKLLLKLIEKVDMEALWEGVKQALRIAEAAAFPIILTGINLTTGEININWLLVKAAVFVALFSGVDKWLHKREDGGTGFLGEKGIAGF